MDFNEFFKQVTKSNQKIVKCTDLKVNCNKINCVECPFGLEGRFTEEVEKLKEGKQ